MYKKITIFLLFIFSFIFSSKNVYAIVDPLSVPNNKFGIHIFSEKDLKDAANLVNSSGGDWGYVTFVITESERDHDRWQKVFNEMRHLHLIPIIRLATKANGDTWEAPQEAEINNWIAFLNSLNWVTQNRYIIVGNEPNHALEWGGRIDPEGYAVYLKNISQKLKSASSDFFILPAGLDPSAANTKTTITSKSYLYRMIQQVPDVFNNIDGWTSHAYPNASLDIYNSEQQITGKNLPVFITETGWTNDKFTEDEINNNLQNAYRNIWNNPKIIAVTPFILDYTSPPFDKFSWKKKDGTYYKYFFDVQKTAKTKGEPVQIEKGQIFAALAEPVIFSGLDFVGAILAKNTGQTVWSQSDISIGSESEDFWLKGYSVNDIEPSKLGIIFFRAAAKQNSGIYTNSLFLTGGKNQKITNSFSIEAGFFDLGKMHLSDLFAKMMASVFRLLPL